jgi:hypothetical protein
MLRTLARSGLLVLVAIVASAPPTVLAQGTASADTGAERTSLTLGPAAQYGPRGAVRTLTGRLSAGVAGVPAATVLIEHSVRGAWRASNTVRTRSDGTYGFRVHPGGPASFRVRFAGTADLAGAYSRTATVWALSYAFPVPGHMSYARRHALYPATDIFAACGARIVSPVDGTVLEVNRVDRFVKSRPQGAWKGGRFVSIRGLDGVRHYGAHFQTISRAVRAGGRVRAGQALGTMGHTGNASGVCHLHYALSPVCAGRGDWWLRRGVVYPWRFLDAWRAGRWASPHTAVGTWQRRHGCPRPG